MPYVIGIDFGTESGRAVLVDVRTGEEVATAVHPYRHGVIDEVLPGTDTRLPPDFALQHPGDYIDVLREAVPRVVRESRVSPDDIIGIGTDFTSCTMMPTDDAGTPLCLKPEWRSNPYAWVKLWKHHAAQPEANRINEVARERGEPWLRRYGGKISSEWLFPKIWETLNHAPEVYEAAARFIEAADWIVWQLTGNERRNVCSAGYKGMWSKRDGYPSEDFFAALDPRLRHVVDEKLSRDIYPLTTRAGGLRPDMAAMMGLRPGIAVSVGVIDAHVCVPASTVVEPGRMVIIMGTSNCHMLLGETEQFVEGVAGVVEDGIIPGYFGYEAGQAAVGDIFGWFVKHGVPPAYHDEARQRNISVHKVLEERAARQKPGEHGLLALDWWNGNRSVLMDADLTGLIVGATLQTRAEDIYRALLEATAFGTRMIIEAFERHGIEVREIIASGGLPDRNPLLMQIYADVTGREIRVAASKQAGALGAAMHAAVAAGKEAGGYENLVEAARHMAHLEERAYRPNPDHTRVYDQLFAEYVRLHDYFGRGTNEVMKRLKRLRAEALGHV